MDIIKAKIVGSDGSLKGRAYTYKSVIPVAVGDRVVADMSGTKKELEVVEIGIPESEIEGMPYDIKLIDGMSEPENIAKFNATTSIDIKVVEEILPVLKINFDEVKAHLSKMLSTYQGIVVTEQTLQGCKATQKELAGYRTKIDKYRKEKKKKASAPIAAFESQCKELIAMVEDVERPIKEGIAIYDDCRRNAKRKEAEKIREELLLESGLNDKYASKLPIKDVYCNLSAQKTMIVNDMKAEIEILKEKQLSDELKEQAIVAAIESQNGRLNKKLSLDDFKYILCADLPTIIREIQLKADIIFEAENPIQQETSEIETEPEPVAFEECKSQEKIECAVYNVRIQGEVDKIKHIVGMAKANGLDVEIIGAMNL